MYRPVLNGKIRFLRGGLLADVIDAGPERTGSMCARSFTAPHGTMPMQGITRSLSSRPCIVSPDLEFA